MRSDRGNKKKEFLEKLGGEKVLQRENRRLRERERILVDAICEIKASHEGHSDQPIQDIIDGCMTELSNATENDKFDRTTKYKYLEAHKKEQAQIKRRAYETKMLKEMANIIDGD